MTLYAKWTADVTFEADGGTPAPESQTINEGGKLTKPEPPTKEGLTFAGWYKDENYETPWDFENNEVTESMTLYARWTADVTFEANGGTPVPESQTINEGGKVTKPDDPSKGNLIFAGWYKDEGYTTLWDFENDVVNESMTLYAKWNLVQGEIEITSDPTKLYDGNAVTPPTYETNSTGAVTIEYKSKDADDSTYTTTAPTEGGEYTVRVSVAEDETYTAASATKDFIINCYYYVDPATGIRFEWTEGVLPMNEKFTVNDVSLDDSVLDDVDSEYKVERILVFDITIDGADSDGNYVKDGIEYMRKGQILNGKVKVTIPMDLLRKSFPEWEISDTIMLRLSPGNNNDVNLDEAYYDKEQDKYVFETDHFSNYAVIDIDTSDQGGTSTDPTPEGPVDSDTPSSDPSTSNPAASDTPSSDPSTSNPAASDTPSSDPSISDPEVSDTTSLDLDDEESGTFTHDEFGFLTGESRILLTVISLLMLSVLAVLGVNRRKWFNK